MSTTSLPASQPPYTLEFYVDDDGRELVRDWLRSLTLDKRRVLGASMNEVLQHMGVDVCKTEFGKPLKGGLFEFRVRRDEILLRVFCHAHGDKLILLLGGYDKGEDPSPKRQQEEIAGARRRLASWKKREQASKRA